MIQDMQFVGQSQEATEAMWDLLLRSPADFMFANVTVANLKAQLGEGYLVEVDSSGIIISSGESKIELYRDNSVITNMDANHLLHVMPAVQRAGAPKVA